jgi:murein DD-endopeptidase MepM/ murein hydrolase activator NlpD
LGRPSQAPQPRGRYGNPGTRPGVGVRGIVRFWSVGTAAAVVMAMLSGTAPVAASEVSDALRANKRVDRRIHQITREARTRSRALHRAVTTTQRENDARPGRQTLTTLRQARRNERRFNAWTGERLEVLATRRDGLRSWLATWAIFRVCPVDAPRFIHDDFGEIVSVEGVEPHVHMGSDIGAPTWTPIRAPFDGYASSSFSPLGGYQVYVRGDLGYVFNAHLIAYGDLGWVRAGTIIGYVGATGDSTAPHDHFEWHPWHGRAVDPYYLLTLVCD